MLLTTILTHSRRRQRFQPPYTGMLRSVGEYWSRRRLGIYVPKAGSPVPSGSPTDGASSRCGFTLLDTNGNENENVAQLRAVGFCIFPILTPPLLSTGGRAHLLMSGAFVWEYAHHLYVLRLHDHSTFFTRFVGLQCGRIMADGYFRCSFRGA